MGPARQVNTRGAKRKLNLDDEEDPPVVNKRNSTSANTAIKITEFADRQQAIARVNKESNLKKGKNLGKTNAPSKSYVTDKQMNSRTNVDDVLPGCSSADGNELPPVSDGGNA